MNTAELNNSSFDLLPLFPALGIVLLAAAAMAVLWGILTTVAVSPSVSRSTTRLATSAGER